MKTSTKNVLMTALLLAVSLSARASDLSLYGDASCDNGTCSVSIRGQNEQACRATFQKVYRALLADHQEIIGKSSCSAEQKNVTEREMDQWENWVDRPTGQKLPTGFYEAEITFAQ